MWFLIIRSNTGTFFFNRTPVSFSAENGSSEWKVLRYWMSFAINKTDFYRSPVSFTASDEGYILNWAGHLNSFFLLKNRRMVSYFGNWILPWRIRFFPASCHNFLCYMKRPRKWGFPWVASNWCVLVFWILSLRHLGSDLQKCRAGIVWRFAVYTHRAGEILIWGTTNWGPKICHCSGHFDLSLFLFDFSVCKIEITTPPLSLAEYPLRPAKQWDIMAK